MLGCLVGYYWSGFGILGRGLSSALVGSGYGWVGLFVGLGGGLFSLCLCLEGVECVCVWRARSDSGEWGRWCVGLGCGGVGDFGSVGQKNFTTSWLLLKFADFRGE